MFADLLELLWLHVLWPVLALAELFGFLWKKEKDVSKVGAYARQRTLS